MRISMGQLVTTQGPMSGSGPVDQQTGSYECNWFQNMIYGAAMCASAETATPAPPLLPDSGAPTVASVDPVTGAVTMLTPDQQQAANVAAIQAQATANAPVDCTQLWNQLTNSACPCTYCTSYGSYLAIGVGVILLIWAANKL